MDRCRMRLSSNKAANLSTVRPAAAAFPTSHVILSTALARLPKHSSRHPGAGGASGVQGLRKIAARLRIGDFPGRFCSGNP
jgi:hypothetical protein